MLEFMTTIQVKKLTELGLKIDPEVFKKLLALDGAAQDYFGVSVAVSQTSVVISAINHLTKGGVYVY